ncbi:MAG: glycosyltransferase [Deltaproteobacteria bacterium]|nr:glycosyltransferase [Deltaproteobacteria bacterium]
MKIALYHGYELSGSGSNEYTRYLVRTLAEAGHEVLVICRDFTPESYDFVSRAVGYDQAGEPRELFSRPGRGVTLHQLPPTSIFPVYITDQQREGHVKAFPELTEAELAEYHGAMVAVLKRVLRDERPDVLHCNHLVYQPAVAVEACEETQTPFYVVPHGSAIEYTVKKDARFQELARRGLEASKGVLWIAREVRDRVYGLFPDLAEAIKAKSQMVGIGTDTSLFRPLSLSERRGALDELAAQHQPGGKRLEQREELARTLGAEREVTATRHYWDAYDHKLPDADLPAQLARLPAEGELLFFVGAMTYGKGIQSLIAAMPAILRERPDVHLVLVGSGTYREVLEALVFALGSGDEALFAELVRSGQDLERATMSGPLEDLLAHVRRPEKRRVRVWRQAARAGAFLGSSRSRAPAAYFSLLSCGGVSLGDQRGVTAGLRRGVGQRCAPHGLLSLWIARWARRSATPPARRDLAAHVLAGGA